MQKGSLRHGCLARMVVGGAFFLGLLPLPAFAHSEYLTSVSALKSEINSPAILILDTRSAQAYGFDHIPGAVNLSPHTLDRTVTLASGATVPSMVKPAAEVTAILQAIGMNTATKVVIYADRFEPSATRLFWVLDYYGKHDISLLDGGLAQWERDGASLSDSASAPRPRGDFVATPDPQKIADYAYVERHLGSESTEICDALPSDSFAQGAIPGSVSLPASTFGNQGTLAARAAWLAEAMREHRLTPGHEVIFYCATGYLSSMDYFVARLLGYHRVRLYDGSLVDWTAHGGRLAPDGEGP